MNLQIFLSHSDRTLVILTHKHARTNMNAICIIYKEVFNIAIALFYKTSLWLERVCVYHSLQRQMLPKCSFFAY